MSPDTARDQSRRAAAEFNKGLELTRPEPSTTGERRYYGLDALRGVMMLLGIVIHAAMFYTVMESDVFPFKDRRTSPLLDLVLLLIHSFRMPLFFLVSGFFGALLVEKYGTKPHVPSLVYYGTFFVVGYLFHGFRDFLATCERHLVAYSVASTLVFLASLAPSALDYKQGGTTTWLHLVTISLNGLLTWLLVCAAIGLFQRFLDRDSPWVAYISQSSYWVYLVHLPIVSFAAWCLVDVDVPAVVKFALAGAFTAVVAFVSYHWLVRRTWISVLLNGRRFTMGWPWLEPKGRAYSTAMAQETDPARS